MRQRAYSRPLPPPCRQAAEAEGAKRKTKESRAHRQRSSTSESGSLHCLKREEKEGEAKRGDATVLPPVTGKEQEREQGGGVGVYSNRTERSGAERSWLSGRPQEPPPLTLGRGGRRGEKPPCGHDASLQHRKLSVDGGESPFQCELNK